ncbi:MAG: hypothetical protein AAF717_05765 [Bacteroidota bacterium]
MKNVILMVVALGGFALVNAQKVIEKNIPHKNQYVELDVPFASEIDIKTWDKKEVYFKANIDTEYPQYLDLYELEVKENSTSITIASKTKAIFKAFEGERKKTKKRYYYTEYTFDYTLYVPKNTEFRVSSINGSMRSEVIEGNFEAELINGDIEIAKYSGDLDLSTINGTIDLKVGGARFTAETVNGDIYADGALDITSDDRYVGQKVRSTIDSYSSKLRLNTVNGNMYLRL